MINRYIYIHVYLYYRHLQLSQGGPYAKGNNINHNVSMNKIRSARFRLLTQSTSPWQVCVLMLFCIDTAIYTLCIHIATSFMNLVDRLIISLRTNIVVPKTFIGMNHPLNQKLYC